MSDKPAFPTDTEQQIADNTWHFSGMTLREYTAIKICAAMVSGVCEQGAESYIAKSAIKLTDELLKQLDEQP